MSVCVRERECVRVCVCVGVILCVCAWRGDTDFELDGVEGNIGFVPGASALEVEIESAIDKHAQIAIV